MSTVAWLTDWFRRLEAPCGKFAAGPTVLLSLSIRPASRTVLLLICSVLANSNRWRSKQVCRSTCSRVRKELSISFERSRHFERTSAWPDPLNIYYLHQWLSHTLYHAEIREHICFLQHTAYLQRALLTLTALFPCAVILSRSESRVKKAIDPKLPSINRRMRGRGLLLSYMTEDHCGVQPGIRPGDPGDLPTTWSWRKLLPHLLGGWNDRSCTRVHVGPMQTAIV